MMDFLKQNGGTLVVGIVLLAVVILIVVKMRKDKNKGKSISCGSCTGCSHAGSCHKRDMQLDPKAGSQKGSQT